MLNDSPQELAAVLRPLLGAANQNPVLRNVFSIYQADVPQIRVDSGLGGALEAMRYRLAPAPHRTERQALKSKFNTLKSEL